MMKVAIFHNFLDNIGGAEKVALTLSQKLNADLYTTNFDLKKISQMGFTDVNIKSIGRIPINAPFRQQAALWRFRQLNLQNQYDFYIIAGDWAISGAVNHQPNLWYVHSPIREIWDLYQYTRQNTVPKYQRRLFDFWVRANRYLNKKYVKSVNQIACNSQNTQNRLKKYLNRQAQIIYPPIETRKFYYEKNGDYWLSVNRLITQKRIKMQLRAFARMPEEKLIIVGSYEKAKHFKKYANYIKKTKPANVEILSWINEDQLQELYANCRGFITTAHDEDFGMTAVEAMASGKPIIAPDEGGYKESIINSQTGILIGKINADKLVQAIKHLNQNPEKYKNACQKQASKFDQKIFIEKINAIIQQTLGD